VLLPEVILDLGEMLLHPAEGVDDRIVGILLTPGGQLLHHRLGQVD
jgi:hypothetical protein